MKLINNTIAQLEHLGGSRWGKRLAHALYSACHHGDFPGPNLLNLSSGLDTTGRELVKGLIDITQQPDYSNDDQANALRYIEQRYGQDTIDYWEKGDRP